MKLTDAAGTLPVVAPYWTQKPPPPPPIVKRGPDETDNIVHRLIVCRVDQSDGGLIRIRHVPTVAYARVRASTTMYPTRTLPPLTSDYLDWSAA